MTLLAAEADAPYVRPLLSKELLRGETDEATLEEEAWFAEHRRRAAATRPRSRRSSPARAGCGSPAARRSPSRPACSPPARTRSACRCPAPRTPGSCNLRSLHDARALRARAQDAHSAAVIGSGFIGCEAAASLAMRGLRVTLISDEAVVHAARLGEAAGRRIADWLAELGVSLRLGAPVESVGSGSVRVAGAPPIGADLVLFAVGVRPRAELAEAAGLEVRDGRIVTDERMRTSAPGIYAAGDVALARNAAAGRHLPVEHWGEALNQGEVAGRSGRRRRRGVGHRARLLVDDRQPHAQARRLGRRLRRGPPRRPPAAPSPSGTARRDAPSACSPTSATRTTSAGAS